MEKIYYVKPSITSLEIEYASAGAITGWGENSNLYVNQFETAFSKKVGSAHAIATSSCTGALHLGLAAIGIKAGDEIILADINWIATVAPVIYLGATPVLVDIDRETWCINPEEVRSKINSKTKAIIATHIYGNLCDMTELKKIAQEFGLYLVEDAAEAIGSYYHDNHAGTIGDFGVFSFHGSKTITTGEGGMLVTNNNKIAAEVHRLNNHGRSASEKRQFWPSSIGFKYRISNVPAAIGLAQVSRFDELVERKREILRYYKKGLENYKDISINPDQEWCVSGAWMPNVVYSVESGVRREHLVQAFQNQNIDARVFFWPLSSFDFIHSSFSTPIGKDIGNRSINLPSYHDMTNDQQNRIIEILVKLLH